MKKLFTLFFALVATTALWAYDFQSGDLYYNITSDSTVEVTEGNYSGEIIIPETVTYNGTTYRVTSIGEEAFNWCYRLTSITIGNSVTSIGEHAFEDCSRLTSITIPNSVTSIGEEAFMDCSSLTSITIPNSVTYVGGGMFYGCSKLKSVVLSNNISLLSSSYNSTYFGFFEGCSSLTSITIPNSVTYIGERAFAGCSSLTSVTIPNSVTWIGGSTFGGCSSLTSITIPNRVTSIGRDAFGGCYSLTSITIPNSVTYIGDEAFSYCSSLTSVSIPNSVMGIGGGVFNRCSSLTSVTIGNSVMGIGKDAFSSCSSLTSVNIPNSVMGIGEAAFYGCSALTSITIPESVMSIGHSAFHYCRSLNTLTCLAMTPPALGEDVFEECDNPTLFVPCAALSDYQLHMQWRKFRNIECISSEETETEEVVVESGTTTVIITWPTEDGVHTYTIVIKKDGAVVCTLTFNSEGQLISIAFAPGRDGNHPAQYAEQAANGYRFTVTGLEEATDYTYTITTKDASNKTINTHSGKFTTKSITAVENTHSQSPMTNCQKILRDGQLLILRDGVEYNAMGQEL